MTSPARFITSSVVLRLSPRPLQETVTRAPAPVPKASSNAAGMLSAVKVRPTLSANNFETVDASIASASTPRRGRNSLRRCYRSTCHERSIRGVRVSIAPLASPLLAASACTRSDRARVARPNCDRPSICLTSAGTLQYWVPRGCGQSPWRLRSVPAKLLDVKSRHSFLSLCLSQNAGSQPTARTCVARAPDASPGKVEPALGAGG